MYAIPHTFPSLVDLGVHPCPVLLIGSGMSHGIAPMPNELLEAIASRQDEIEQELNCTTSIVLGGQTKELYVWAQAIIDELEASGDAESDAKRRLADAVGVTRNPRFRAQVDIPLRGNTPRHRVVSRFAREGRWASIWSLNWDIIMESALESVGLRCYTGGVPRLPQTWVEWYMPWTQPDPQPIVDYKILRMIKPHGCIAKLLNGHPTFLIGSRELSNIGPQYRANHSWLQNDLSGRPLVTIGWSASERYIRSIVRDTAKRNVLGANGQADTLGILDIADHPSRGQAVIMARYGKDKASSYVQLEKKNCPELDDLLIWLQTRYGLNCLVQIFQGIDQAVAKCFREQLDSLEEPNCSDVWVNGWFDDFLPVWIRLCFNSCRVVFLLNAQPLQSHVIPTHRRDEHIPWGDHNILRPDLKAAGYLFCAISESTRSWDFSEFPGGLWDLNERHLVLPIPAWKADVPLQLTALKPLMEDRHWPRKGLIKRLSILPLSDDPNADGLTLDVIENWKAQVAQLMKSAELANHERIQVIDQDVLRG